METMRLGEMISVLERKDPNAKVSFEFGAFVPTTIDSWRGIYAELAVGYAVNQDAPTVTEFITRLRACIGNTYTGYKGGKYTMNEHTRVWCDNWGEWTRTAIVDIRDHEDEVVLITARCD